MRRVIAFTAVVGMILSASSVEAQSLDDAAVDAAIKAGQNKKHGPLFSSCVATAGFGENMAAAIGGGVTRTGSFTVIVSRSAGRIAYMAADAKRLYKPFAISDVPDRIRANNLVYVTVVPHDPQRLSNQIDVASPIERVVLKSKTNPNAVAQPQDMELTPLEWKNLVGGVVDGNAAVATFPLGDVLEFPAGDFDIVVVTQAGERRCKVGKGDRQRLFGK